jgi:O-antigen/teichoic acid export membrane protein
MATVFPQRSHPIERTMQPPVEADRRGSLLRHLSRYSVARYLSEVLFLIRGILLARILGPAAFGLWSQMKIALLFLQYGKLGASEAMLREIPFAAGRGDEGRAGRIRRAVFAFDLLASGMLGLALVGGSLLAQGWSADLRISWVLLAAAFLLSQVFWFAQARLRTEKRFGQVGRMLVWVALLSTAVGVPAAWQFGLPGFLVALTLAHAAVLLPAIGGGHALPRPQWDSSIVGEMLRIGFPIMAASALLLLLWNVDKLAVWVLMSREDLGIYALGAYLLIPAMLIPETVSVVLYPRLMEQFGKSANRAELEHYITRPTLVMSYLGCPALGLIFLVIHLPIQWLLPRYAPGIVPAQILVTALFFMVVARMPQVLLVSLSRQKLLLLLTAASIVVASVVAAISIRSGAGLIGAACGATAGFATYAVLVGVAAVKSLNMTRWGATRFACLTVLPCIVVAAAVALSLVVTPGTTGELLPDLAWTALRCLTLLVVSGLLIGMAHRRFGLLRRER